MHYSGMSRASIMSIRYSLYFCWLSIHGFIVTKQIMGVDNGICRTIVPFRASRYFKNLKHVRERRKVNWSCLLITDSGKIKHNWKQKTKRDSTEPDSESPYFMHFNLSITSEYLVFYFISSAVAPETFCFPAVSPLLFTTLEIFSFCN